jgi:DNA-directed RNA polymerase specialized sigma24 family protein
LTDPQLDRFFRQNFPVIRAKCARMLGESEEAADVAQETFVRLCESGAVHEDPDVRARWIYATSTRIAIDRLRRRRLGIETREEPAADCEGRGRGARGEAGALGDRVRRDARRARGGDPLPDRRAHADRGRRGLRDLGAHRAAAPREPRPAPRAPPRRAETSAHPSHYALDRAILGAPEDPEVVRHVAGCARCARAVAQRRAATDAPAWLGEIEVRAERVRPPWWRRWRAFLPVPALYGGLGAGRHLEEVLNLSRQATPFTAAVARAASQCAGPPARRAAGTAA